MSATADPHVVAAEGVELASKVIKALALDEDEQALALLNAAAESAIRWCAATLASWLRTVVLDHSDSPAKARHELIQRAHRGRDDALVTAMEVIVDEQARRDGDDA